MVTRWSTALIRSLVALAFAATPLFAQASGKEHALAGEVKRIDAAGKVIVLTSADGVEETVKLTDRTSVKGAKDVALATDAAAKAALEGSAVILYFTGPGVDRTALAITNLGKRTLFVARGTIIQVDNAGQFFVIKTTAGPEQLFNLTKAVVLDSPQGVGTVASDTAGALRGGAEVTVHYSQEGTKQVVHLIKHN